MTYWQERSEGSFSGVYTLGYPGSNLVDLVIFGYVPAYVPYTLLNISLERPTNRILQSRPRSTAY